MQNHVCAIQCVFFRNEDKLNHTKWATRVVPPGFPDRSERARKEARRKRNCNHSRPVPGSWGSTRGTHSRPANIYNLHTSNNISKVAAILQHVDLFSHHHAFYKSPYTTTTDGRREGKFYFARWARTIGPAGFMGLGAVVCLCSGNIIIEMWVSKIEIIYVIIAGALSVGF